MRGNEGTQGMLFTVVNWQDRIPTDHPLRAVRTYIDPILRDLSPQFEALYSRVGRPSVPPEQLLRALLLQLFYSIRSERQLVEQLEYNLLFRWFVGLELDAPAWHATTFTKNRARLLDGAVAANLLAGVVRTAEQDGLLSKERFTVDGTLLEAWASHKSFQPKEGPPNDSDGAASNPDVNFRGARRSNATHALVTDPDVRLARKPEHTAAILAYQASVLLVNRHGLLLSGLVGTASGRAEVEQALTLVQGLPLSPRPPLADGLLVNPTAAATAVAGAPFGARQNDRRALGQRAGRLRPTASRVSSAISWSDSSTSGCNIGPRGIAQSLAKDGPRLEQESVHELRGPDGVQPVCLRPSDTEDAA